MRKVLICSLAALMTLGVQARQLTPAEALTRAIGSEAVSYTSPSRGDGITLVYTSHDANTGSNGLYVFNRAGNEGFLIVSADDVVTPLLGYADAGSFDAEAMPDNLRAWLEEYTSQIAWASTATSGGARTVGGARPSRAAIAPMCATLWNQSSPYNDMCPLYQGKRSVTGCVATALAQVLKYHNYPVRGTGSNSYTTKTYGLTASFDYANTTFNWDKMLDAYSSDSPADSKTAVATLMYAAGVSVNMDYTPNESGAASYSVGRALLDYFNYDKGVSLQNRNWYGMYEWEDLVYENLSTCGPVLLGGNSGSGGHEFVCDGYDKDGYFHINWGWGGLSNGYFLLTALDPGEQGIGGSAGGYNFNQDAMIGIRKPMADSKYVEIMAANNLNGAGGNARATVSGPFVNSSYAALSEVYVGLEINGAYYTSSGRIAKLEPMYGISEYEVPLSGLPAGTYKAYPVFKTSNAGWQRMKTSVSGVRYLNLTVSVSGAVAVTQSALPTIEISGLSLDTPMSPGNLYRISALATNNGADEYVNTLYPVLVSGSEDAVILTQYAIDVPAGEDVAVTIEASLPTTVAIGNYTLYLAEMDGEEVRPIGDGISVTIEKYVAPALAVSSFTIDNSEMVDASDITVRAVISNTGGYFYGQLQAVIFPYEEGSVTSIDAITSPVIEIPANASGREIVFSGSFPEGETGKQYIMMLYYGRNLISEQRSVFKVGTSTGVSDIADDGDVVSVEVYTPSGIKVLTSSDMRTSGDVLMSDLPAGLYIVVSTHADGHRSSNKIVKR